MTDDTEGKDNVVDIFSKAKQLGEETDYKKVSQLVDAAIHDLFDALSNTDKEEFKSFLWDHHPGMAVKLFGGDISVSDIQIDVDKIAEKIADLEGDFQGAMDKLSKITMITAQSYADIENSSLKYLNDTLGEVLKGYNSIKY
jgi:hypothetical protein